MQKRIWILLIIAYMLVMKYPLMNIAFADIPSDIKESYQYDKSDKSIITVKKRLQELGYFSKSAEFSNKVNDTLKEAVISFQNTNGMKADGVIDKEFLEQLFSSEAVEKDGKKKETQKPYINTANQNTTVVKHAQSTTKKQNDGSGVVISADVALLFAIASFTLAIIFFVIMNKLAKRKVSKETEIKVQELVTIIERYKSIRQDGRAKQVINNSGLIFNVLAMCGEYLFIPLTWKENNPVIRFDTNVVAEAEKRCNTDIFLILDNIVRESMSEDIQYRKILQSWALLKSEKPGAIVGVQAYRDLKKLYSALVSSRIIKINDSISMQAFFLLLWECVLDENYKFRGIMNGYYNNSLKMIAEWRSKHIDPHGAIAFADENNIQGIENNYKNAVYIMYETFDLTQDKIVFMLTAREYVDNVNTMWHTIYLKHQNNVKVLITEIENRRYVMNLLNQKGRKRVTISEIDFMEPSAFERLVRLIFEKMGYKAMVTKQSGDQGVDVVAEKKGRRVVIQAKCYQGTVGNKAVQEVVAGKQMYHALDAYVVTNSTFTKQAIELAKVNNVELWDRNILSQMLDRYFVFASEL